MCKIKHFSASVQEICRFSAESDGISGKKRNFAARFKNYMR